ncbi:methyltransferase domain-containing protein [candidate division WWE3 bacterium]|nr:methyltransferase domain-containing protein [candidate division WWE3 bacterium]
MKIVSGNKIEEFFFEDFGNLTSHYEKVVIDFGTGDGRFVYKLAKQNSDILFVGVDPIGKQMREYSKKANREGLCNLLFVIGSLENIPTELLDTANMVYINLPWGSLLKAIVEPQITQLRDISKLLKKDGELQILLGYDPKLEPKLDLGNLTPEIFTNRVIPTFRNLGFEVLRFELLDKDDLKEIQTTWSKKLGFGQTRPTYKLHLKTSQA